LVRQRHPCLTSVLQGPCLQAYHCSGSDTVLGSVNVGGSVVILLLIGFVVGFGLAWFIFWRRQRKQMLLDLEYRDRFPEKGREAPDISPIVQSAAEPVAPAPASSFRTEPKLPQTAAALASGPLAMGARDSAVLPAKQPPQRTSSGNPFAGVEPYNVVRNPTSSLDSSLDGPLARSVARTTSGAVELQSAGGRACCRLDACLPVGLLAMEANLCSFLRPHCATWKANVGRCWHLGGCLLPQGPCNGRTQPCPVSLQATTPDWQLSACFAISTPICYCCSALHRWCRPDPCWCPPYSACGTGDGPELRQEDH
jgi:hypothetical protein